MSKLQWNDLNPDNIILSHDYRVRFTDDIKDDGEIWYGLDLIEISTDQGSHFPCDKAQVADIGLPTEESKQHRDNALREKDEVSQAISDIIRGNTLAGNTTEGGKLHQNLMRAVANAQNRPINHFKRGRGEENSSAPAQNSTKDISDWVKSASTSLGDDTREDYANADEETLLRAIAFAESCLQKYTRRLEILKELLNQK